MLYVYNVHVYYKAVGVMPFNHVVCSRASVLTTTAELFLHVVRLALFWAVSFTVVY
jgi:hypothetical protein